MNIDLIRCRILIDALELYILKHRESMPERDRLSLDGLLSELSNIAGRLSI